MKCFRNFSFFTAFISFFFLLQPLTFHLFVNSSIFQYIDSTHLNDRFVPFTSMDLSYLEKYVRALNSMCFFHYIFPYLIRFSILIFFNWHDDSRSPRILFLDFFLFLHFHFHIQIHLFIFYFRIFFKHCRQIVFSSMANKFCSDSLSSSLFVTKARSPSLP